MSARRLDRLVMPEYVQHADEVAAAEDLRRTGMAEDVPPTHRLVIATTRHRFRDAGRGLDFIALPGQAYAMPHDRVAANVAAGLVIVPTNATIEWFTAPGRVLLAEAGTATPLVTAPTPASLKIAAGCGYDPGSAAFRLHSAINEHTHHASAFIRWGDSNPHCDLRQFDGIADGHVARQAVQQADVIHNHVAYFLLNNTGVARKSWQLLVRHYHGSQPNGGTHLEPQWDTARGAMLFGARLQLVAEAERAGLAMRWSPIPMPVDRYAAMAQAIREEHGWTPLDGAATKARPFVIAHSPTNTRIKGTDALRRAVATLEAKGVPVQLEMIHGVSLREALERKALADVCFDSFWLGIQGSGLEAAAMGLPVIAGDHEAAALVSDVNGGCPYEFANDEEMLTKALTRLAMDAGYRRVMTERAHAYVRRFHDYPAVAARYEADLSAWLGRDVRTPPMAAAPVPDAAQPKKRARPRQVAA